MNPFAAAAVKRPGPSLELMPSRGAFGGLAGGSNLKKNHPKTGANSSPSTARFRLIVDD